MSDEAQAPAGGGEWPFPAGEDAPVLTQRAVAFFERPVLLVLHDPEGDWQMLTGDARPGDRAHVMSLGRVVARDPSLRQLADLPRGWIARRKGTELPWERLAPGEPLPVAKPAAAAEAPAAAPETPPAPPPEEAP